MVYAQPEICSREWDAQTTLGFRDANGSPDLDQTTRSYNNQPKKKKEKKRELAELWTLLSQRTTEWN